jgi:ribosomal protein S1
VSHPRQIVSIGQSVEVTVVEVDPVKRRIGLSMVERAKQAKDAAEVEERRDTDKVLAQSTESRSLGTLGDLLAKSAKRKG